MEALAESVFSPMDTVIVATQLTCRYIYKKKKKNPQMYFENSVTHCQFGGVTAGIGEFVPCGFKTSLI